MLFFSISESNLSIAAKCMFAHRHTKYKWERSCVKTQRIVSIVDDGVLTHLIALFSSSPLDRNLAFKLCSTKIRPFEWKESSSSGNNKTWALISIKTIKEQQLIPNYLGLSFHSLFL